jgi:hypothetical protein
MKRRAAVGIGVCLAFAFSGILIQNSRRCFPVVDEIAHLPAGASHIEFGRFDLYRVNPPLVRLLAIGLGGYDSDRFDWTRYADRVGSRAEFTIGGSFLRTHGLAAVEDFVRPRLVALGFWVLGAWLMYAVGRRVGGMRAAAMSCVLWMASPNLLAHAPTILPDVGAVSLGLLACFAAWKYLHDPDVGSAFLAGLALGLALLTKLTWITALVTLPATAAICLWLLAGKLPGRGWRRRCGDLLVFWIVTLYVLNTGYAFEGSLTPLGEYEFCSETLGGEGSNRHVHGNRFAESWLAAVPVPLPRNYVLGIDYLKMEVEQKRWSFLLGEWKHGSWPHYYLMTTLIKTPEPTLLAAGLGVVIFVVAAWRRLASPELISLAALLTVPAMVCFASVSLQGGFNHHHRYVLMIYPPMFLFASLLASPLAGEVFRRSRVSADERRTGTATPLDPAATSLDASATSLDTFTPPLDPPLVRGENILARETEKIEEGDGHRGSEERLQRETESPGAGDSPLIRSAARWHWTGILAVVLVTLSVVSSLRVHPHYVSYFNTLSGGPENGWRLLGFSNIDWGQDLLEVKKWIDEHPECRPVALDLQYFTANGEIFDLPHAMPPKLPSDASVDEVRTDETQWFIVSVRRLYNRPESTGLEYLQQLEPADRIAYAYHVYRIDPK